MWRDADDILSRIRLQRLYGDYVEGTLVYQPCPFHNDNTEPNMLINDTYTYCFACGKHETAIEHIRRVKGITLYAKAWRVAERLCDEQGVERKREEPQPISKTDAKVYHKKLMRLPNKQQWLMDKYGYPHSMLRRLHLGYTGLAYSFPVYNLERELINIRYRRDDKALLPNEQGELAPLKSKFWGVKGRNLPEWYIPPVLLEEGPAESLWEVIARYHGANWVVLTEGEPDAGACIAQGIPALSATDGVTSVLANFVHKLRDLEGLSVYVAYDMDTQGRQGGTKVVEHLKSFGIWASLLSWDSGLGKDTGELSANGINLWAALDLDTKQAAA